MKYCRASYEGRTVHGWIEGEEIAVLNADAIAKPEAALTGERIRLAEARLLAPCTPTKVVAVGINYRDHAGEMGHELPPDPVIFLKPPSAVIGPDDAIVKPGPDVRVDHEAELALIIGAKCRFARAEDASDYIFGYTCCNDVTAREIQKKDGQWTRGKGFDTFCPLGPCVETQLDAGHTTVEARLNGAVRQHSTTDLMINSIGRIIEFVSAVMTLLPGDVITTGTPAGIGPMQAGDIIEVSVGGVGTLRNPVR